MVSREILGQRYWALRRRLARPAEWLELGRLVASLGPTKRARLWLRVVAIYMPLRDLLMRRTRRRPIGVTIGFGGMALRWRLRRGTDLAVAREVLIEDEYALEIGEPEVILDLGSHLGFSILFFRATYPRARIVGVEPDPATFACLSENVGGLPGVELHHAAVTDNDGEVAFFPARDPWISSLGHKENAEPVIAPGRSLDSLLAELGIEELGLLKIDIEGAELEVFRSSTRLADIRAITGELHDGGDETLRNECLAPLSGFDVRTKGEAGRHTTFTAVARAKA